MRCSTPSGFGRQRRVCRRALATGRAVTTPRDANVATRRGSPTHLPGPSTARRACSGEIPFQSQSSHGRGCQPLGAVQGAGDFERGGAHVDGCCLAHVDHPPGGGAGGRFRRPLGAGRFPTLLPVAAVRGHVDLGDASLDPHRAASPGRKFAEVLQGGVDRVNTIRFSPVPAPPGTPMTWVSPLHRRAHRPEPLRRRDARSPPPAGGVEPRSAIPATHRTEHFGNEPRRISTKTLHLDKLHTHRILPTSTTSRSIRPSTRS